MLQVRNLAVRFGSFLALEDVSLEVGEDELVVLLGSNGAGKSTLFRTLSGLDRPAAGHVYFYDQDLSGLSPDAIVRAGIAHCPEGRKLFPDLSVRKNLTLGGYVHRRDKAAVRYSLERVHDLFPMLADKADEPAGSLSGGQQQMVAIGRALMARPRLLLLDEPSLGLAPQVVEQMFEAVAAINRDGTMVLLAEQNANAALQIARRGYVLESGRVKLEGSAKKLLKDPEVRRAYVGT